MLLVGTMAVALPSAFLTLRKTASETAILDDSRYSSCIMLVCYTGALRPASPAFARFLRLRPASPAFGPASAGVQHAERARLQPRLAQRPR